jgi:hypothetical protein
MPRWITCFLLLFLTAAFVPHLRAQDQNDPLTADEVQQIRDSAIHPNERIKLYIKFMNERLDAIRQLAAAPKADDRNAQIRDKLEEFTHLCDELQDNLDTYDAAHADVRKALKDLLSVGAKWPGALNAAGSDPNYDFYRQTALEAAQSASDEAKQLVTEQDAWFQTHKNERGRNGSGPD